MFTVTIVLVRTLVKKNILSVYETQETQEYGKKIYVESTPVECSFYCSMYYGFKLINEIVTVLTFGRYVR